MSDGLVVPLWMFLVLCMSGISICVLGISMEGIQSVELGLLYYESSNEERK